VLTEKIISVGISATGISALQDSAVSRKTFKEQAYGKG
jgi:hypothetical protein